VEPNIALVENVLLAPYTTLKIGGAAQIFLRAKTEEQVVEGLRFARKSGCPVFAMEQETGECGSFDLHSPFCFAALKSNPLASLSVFG
jgi:hypothetical protein